MRVPLAIERRLDVDVPFGRVVTLLDDLESTIRRFPKLRHLKPLGDAVYLWEMEPIGSRAAGIAHSVSYAASYAVDVESGELSWEPLPEHGNAVIGGSFRLQPRAQGTALHFRVRGELRDVPVPLLYRVLAPPFIQGKFARLVDGFLERTHASLQAPPPKARRGGGRRSVR